MTRVFLVREWPLDYRSVEKFWLSCGRPNDSQHDDRQSPALGDGRCLRRCRGATRFLDRILQNYLTDFPWFHRLNPASGIRARATYREASLACAKMGRADSPRPDGCGPQIRMPCFLFRGTRWRIKLFEALWREFGVRVGHAALDARAGYLGHGTVRTVNPEVRRQGFISVE